MNIATLDARIPSDARPARARPTARFLAPLLVPLFLASACTSFTTYKSATPLARGKTQALVAPQLDAAGPKETGKAPFPELALSVRHGLTDKLEVGGTIVALPLGDAMSAVGFEGLAKRHVYRTASGRVDLAVGAGAGYRVFATSGATFEMVHASAPLIVGINLGRANQLVVSPMVAWQRWYSSGAHPVDIPSVGGSLGFRWQLRKSFAILPEISWATTGAALANFDDTVLMHAGVALVFGHAE